MSIHQQINMQSAQNGDTVPERGGYQKNNPSNITHVISSSPKPKRVSTVDFGSLHAALKVRQI